MPLFVPINPIIINHPNELASEKEKFDDGGRWFLNYARWIVLNHYNCYGIADSFTVNGINNNTSEVVTGNGTALSGTTSTSIVNEMLANYEYYYGVQQNRIFNSFSLTGSTTFLFGESTIISLLLLAAY